MAKLSTQGVRIFQWSLPVTTTGLMCALWRPVFANIFDNSVPPFLYYIPVLISGAFGGLGPGLLAVLMSSPLAYEQYRELSATNHVLSDQFGLRFSLYVLVSILVAWLPGRTRDAVSSARVAAEEARHDRQSLASMRDQMAQLIQLNIIGVVFAALDGVITDANDSFLQFTGHTREELAARGLNWKKIIQSDGGSQMMEVVAREGISAPLEKTCLRKDGRTFPVLVRGALLTSTNQVVAFVVDLSDQKSTEAQLRHSRRLMDRVAEATPDMLFLLNMVSMRIQYVNHRSGDLLGYPPEVVQAFSPAELRDLVHPDDINDIAELAEQFDSVTDGGVLETDFRLLNAAGEYRLIRIRAVAFERSLGKCREILALGQDVTQQHATQNALRESHERLEAAGRSKDQFLAALSHELRTPLNPVMAMVSMLEQDARIPPEVREDVHIIRRNVELEARLIDDLLDLTRITHGKMRLNLEAIRADEKVLNALQICRDDLDAKHITLKTHLLASNQTITADAARCQQVVWNLLKNAIKFTPVGGTIHIQTSNPATDTWQLEVIDSGVGITPNMLPHIFDAFEQAGRNLQFGGLGLGLAISKTIVEMHNGRISASSDGPGRGATFRVELPIRHVAAPMQAAPPSAAPASAEELCVLLVEDHEDTARVMARVLRALGHRVAIAGTVKHAAELAEAEAFDLLVCDIGLPDGTGLDVVRAMHAVRRIPAIAVTGYGMDADINRSIAAGFDAHVTKPVDIHRLADLIATITRPAVVPAI